MAVTKQGTNGIGAVDQVTVLDRLPGFRKRTEGLRICPDLGSFPEGKVALDREHDGLVYAPAFFFCCQAQLCLQPRIKP